jgi:DNA-binding MarR family transcriptional regulator
MTAAEHGAAALDRILELVVLLGEDTRQSLAKDGLTSSRASLLWLLGKSGPMTQRALADALKVSARTVTGLVDGLVATGFVSREPHPTDRRATLVTCTAHGAATLRALQQGHKELAALLFGTMSEHRFDCFTAGLDEVLAHLHGKGLRVSVAVDQ